MLIKFFHRALVAPKIYENLQKLIGSKKYERELIRLINVSGGKKVLDIGCGPGTLKKMLPDWHYVGIDNNRAYIKKAKKFIQPGDHLILGDIATTPKLVETNFDLVVLSGVLHHLDDAEARSTLDVAYNNLKPGGEILSVDGVYLPNQQAIAKLALDLDRGAFVRTKEEYLSIYSFLQGEMEYGFFNGLLRVPYDHIWIRCRKS